MSKDLVQIANDVVSGAGLLRQAAPDEMEGFASLARAATAAKALDTKTKELMAVAIGTAVPARVASPTTPEWRIDTAQRARNWWKPLR